MKRRIKLLLIILLVLGLMFVSLIRKRIKPVLIILLALGLLLVPLSGEPCWPEGVWLENMIFH